MAVCFITEFPIQGDDRTTTNYDAVNEKLTHNKAAPEGLLIHYAGFDEDAGVFRITNVWQTKEQGQTYHDNNVMDAVREVFRWRTGPEQSTDTRQHLRAPSRRAPLTRALLQRPMTLVEVARCVELVSQLRGPGAKWSAGA